MSTTWKVNTLGGPITNEPQTAQHNDFKSIVGPEPGHTPWGCVEVTAVEFHAPPRGYAIESNPIWLPSSRPAGLPEGPNPRNGALPAPWQETTSQTWGE
jgi:hypothetical protein